MRPRRETFRQAGQTYFATFQTARRQCFFRNMRWANLMLEILNKHCAQLCVHDFVVMPDHIHLLLSPTVPLERAIQLIKGGFSFRAKREFNWRGDIWQASFSDHRIRDAKDFEVHLSYIAKNASSLRSSIPQSGKDGGLPLEPCPPRLKPGGCDDEYGGAEAPPLQSAEGPALESAEARSFESTRGLPLQSAGAPPLHYHPPNFATRTDIHYAEDAADLFRKSGI